MSVTYVAIPQLYVGQVVHWWYKGIDSHSPLPAMVVSFNEGAGTALLNVFTKGGHRVIDGVKYRYDPELMPLHREKAGFWDTIPQARVSADDFVEALAESQMG